MNDDTYVGWPGKGDVFDYEERAKIRDAAPELLAACRYVLERGDRVPQWILDVLQAAVTKAVSG